MGVLLLLMRRRRHAAAWLTECEGRAHRAVQGMKNHDSVPLQLLVSIAGLRLGGAQKLVAELLRHKLVSHEAVHCACAVALRCDASAAELLLRFCR